MMAVVQPLTETQGWFLVVEVGIIAAVKTLAWLGVRRG